MRAIIYPDRISTFNAPFEILRRHNAHLVKKKKKYENQRKNIKLILFSEHGHLTGTQTLVYTNRLERSQIA